MNINSPSRMKIRKLENLNLMAGYKVAKGFTVINDVLQMILAASFRLYFTKIFI